MNAALRGAGVLAGAAAAMAMLLSVLWIQREPVHPHIGVLVYIVVVLIGTIVFAASLAGGACAIALQPARPLGRNAALVAGCVSAALSMAVQFTVRLGSADAEMLLLALLQAAAAAVCATAALRWPRRRA